MEGTSDIEKLEIDQLFVLSCKLWMTAVNLVESEERDRLIGSA